MRLSLRMSLIGETNDYDIILKTEENVDHDVGEGVFISSISNDTSPVLDLDGLVGRNDAVGELARFLMSVRDRKGLDDNPFMLKIRSGFNGSIWKNTIGNPPSTLEVRNDYDDTIERVERQTKVLIRKLMDSQEA